SLCRRTGGKFRALVRERLRGGGERCRARKCLFTRPGADKPRGRVSLGSTRFKAGGRKDFFTPFLSTWWKRLVFQDYGFHPLVQRWIIGQCLCVDERTVSSYGIRRDGDTAFLYLLSAKRAELTQQRYEEDQQRKYNTLPSMSPKKGPVAAPVPAAGGQEGQPGSCPDPAGWSCPKCTFINKPTRPGCEMCSTDRPDDYVVPCSYKPDETELWRIQQEQEGILQYQQQQRGWGNFQQLLQLEEEVLVPNREVLECRICYQQVAPGEGVLLRECLHNFCRYRGAERRGVRPPAPCPGGDGAGAWCWRSGARRTASTARPRTAAAGASTRTR
uniref:RanBP2-type domain-containing protein n=1 Tax=Anser cygnoides TaxID=8845 RepID=A0A8B9EWG6_ANSCY